MQSVTINIGANANKYWASLQFTDRQGRVHEKKIERDHEGTRNGNCLLAAAEGFRALNRPCMVTVNTDCDYITYAYKNGWVTEWEQNGWKRANGGELKNAEAWRALQEAKAPHSVRFALTEGGR